MSPAILTGEQADIIVSYLEALEERVNHDAMVATLTEQGYSEQEVDDALKMLGRIAGRDCGFM